MNQYVIRKIFFYFFMLDSKPNKKISSNRPVCNKEDIFYFFMLDSKLNKKSVQTDQFHFSLFYKKNLQNITPF
jgi:hypothetical protein